MTQVTMASTDAGTMTASQQTGNDSYRPPNCVVHDRFRGSFVRNMSIYSSQTSRTVFSVRAGSHAASRRARGERRQGLRKRQRTAPLTRIPSQRPYFALDIADVVRDVKRPLSSLLS